MVVCRGKGVALQSSLLSSPSCSILYYLQGSLTIARGSWMHHRNWEPFDTMMPIPSSVEDDPYRLQAGAARPLVIDGPKWA